LHRQETIRPGRKRRRAIRRERSATGALPVPDENMAAMQYILIGENGDLPEIGRFAPFKAVVAAEDRISRDRQVEISNWLVESGALYVMLCGADGETWQQAIRQANLDLVELRDMRPDDFVMITQHGKEKLRGVFWHARKHARHTHVRLDNLLTIHIGTTNRSVEYSAIFDKA
jgi:hypothetical protein